MQTRVYGMIEEPDAVVRLVRICVWGGRRVTGGTTTTAHE